MGVECPLHSVAKASLRCAKGSACKKGLPLQETGLAQIQLDNEGLETVTRIDRPAAVGEQLVLRCAFADARSGLYRLEEAQLPPMEVPYAGEAAEVADEEGTGNSHNADDRVAIVL